MNNAFTQWAWRIYCEHKYLMEEIDILYEHPSRKASRAEVKYHFFKLIDEITHPWYCLKRGVRNFIHWFPTIWRIDVFDHSYLLNIMDKQLEDMEKFFYGPNTHTMHVKQYAKRIRWTRKLLQMHFDEYYTMKHYDDHRAKYGEINHISRVVKEDKFGIPLLYSWESEESPEQWEEYREGMMEAREMDEKVWKLFIKNFSQCRNWWD